MTKGTNSKEANMAPSPELSGLKLGTQPQNSLHIGGTQTFKEPARNSVFVSYYTAAAPDMLFSTVKDPNNPKSRFIAGVDWLDTKVKPVMDAVEQDDPFADQILFDIEQSIESAISVYKDASDDLQNFIGKTLSGSDSSLVLASEPETNVVKILFDHKLAYKVLWLSKELDKVLYFLYQANKLSLITTKEKDQRWMEAKKLFRNVFNQISNWRHTGISREALAQNTAIVRKAFEKNSRIELTPEVLLLEKRADVAPSISAWKNDVLPDSVRERLEKYYVASE
ncbi:AcaB family transcriptional regulator [Vibrio mediterranei]